VAARHDSGVVATLEFWPEYDGTTLWSATGEPVALDSLPMAEALRRRLRDWVARYDDCLLPFDGPGDEQWLREGQELLADVRTALAGSYEVIVTEPWWAGGGGA
jgi:hypothetical protein